MYRHSTLEFCSPQWRTVCKAWASKDPPLEPRPSKGLVRAGLSKLTRAARQPSEPGPGYIKRGWAFLGLQELRHGHRSPRPIQLKCMFFGTNIHIEFAPSNGLVPVTTHFCFVCSGLLRFVFYVALRAMFAFTSKYFHAFAN